MSDVENQEVEAEVETNPVADLVDAIADQNFNRAKEHFDSLLGDRMNDALDQEKIVVADQIFNDVDPDAIDDDIEDEEIEAELDDEVEEEDEEVIEDEDDEDPVAPI